jgi:hypothetical protein
VPTAVDYTVVAVIVYFGVGAVKLALMLPTLKLAIAYSLFLEGKGKNTLLHIVAYSLVAILTSLLGWPLIMKSEGFGFFRAYTEEGVIAAVNEAYDCYQDRRM